MSDRREFLKYLAASPLLFGMPQLVEALGNATTDQAVEQVLKSAADALNVFDLEAAARKLVPPAHWGYMATGSDGETTLRANHEAYSRYQLRVRRFVDVSKIDMSMSIFGQTYASPIILCPVGSQRGFHAEGELAVARAAAARRQLQILSTQSSTPIEDVAKARGAGLWYQLYTSNSFENSAKMVKRAEAAGCPVVAVTVDLPGGRNTETDKRLAREDTRTCNACHGPNGANGTKPMFAGLDMKGFTLTSGTLTWDFVKRLKDVTSMKVMVKGLESGEDAALAVSSGADGIIVSNHGGRQLDGAVAPLRALPRVKEAAGGLTVMMDSGIRRGTDVLKALALGADFVFVGRPFLYGIAIGAEHGAQHVINLLSSELMTDMALIGVNSPKEMKPELLLDRKVYDWQAAGVKK